MNEETIIDKKFAENNQSESKKQGTWKYVMLGGVPGVFIGAGLMAGGHASARETVAEPQLEESQTAESQVEEQTEASIPVVSNVNNDLSFAEAFNAARTAVGPGGVFEWHGGLYNTYTAEEWDAMSSEQKDDFVQQVKPITPVGQLDTPTDVNTHVVVVHDMQQPSHSESANNVHEASAPQQGTHEVDAQVAESYQALESDSVHLVGFADADGHLVAGYDTDSDGQADVAIVDLGEQGFSNDDVIFDGEGNYARIGDLQDQPDPNQYASAENPDVAPDMPDYSNDVYVDA